jgi:hypothetical protein
VASSVEQETWREALVRSPPDGSLAHSVLTALGDFLRNNVDLLIRGELTRELISRRLLLGELHREDIARFLELTTGIAPPQIILEAVYRQTEGNPLFMLSILGEESRWG